MFFREPGSGCECRVADISVVFFESRVVDVSAGELIYTREREKGDCFGEKY